MQDESAYCTGEVGVCRSASHGIGASGERTGIVCVRVVRALSGVYGYRRASWWDVPSSKSFEGVCGSVTLEMGFGLVLDKVGGVSGFAGISPGVTGLSGDSGRWFSRSSMEIKDLCGSEK